MKTNKLFSIFVLLLLSLSSVLAAGNNMFITVTSSPSELPSNDNYALTFNVTDTGNATANVTAKFFVNSVNVVNATWTNNVTVPNGSNVFTTTFSRSYYELGDSVYVNITGEEAGNATVTNSTATSPVTVTDSTNAIIASDTFEGLPSLGEQIGGFLTGLTPGVIAFTFAIAVVGGIILIFVAISKNIGSNISMKR